jgi:actin-related protein
MKEEICYVTLNTAAEMAKSREGESLTKKYELPDGSQVMVKSPRFMAPECLFYPDLIKETDETLGIHKLVYKTILELDIGIRQEMF